MTTEHQPIPLPQRTLSPEQRLCWAMIEDAINTLRRRGVTREARKGTTPAMLVAEVRDWLADGTVRPGSLAWCCAALELAPDYVRRLIAEGEAREGWYVDAKPRSARTIDPSRAAKRAHLQRWRAKRRGLR